MQKTKTAVIARAAIVIRIAFFLCLITLGISGPRYEDPPAVVILSVIARNVLPPAALEFTEPRRRQEEEIAGFQIRRPLLHIQARVIRIAGFELQQWFLSFWSTRSRNAFAQDAVAIALWPPEKQNRLPDSPGVPGNRLRTPQECPGETGKPLFGVPVSVPP